MPIDELTNASYLLKSFKIPDSSTIIPESFFVSHKYLETVLIPSGVTSIGHSAFAGCSLTSITIPDSVTSIDSYAFGNCTSLSKITISGNTSIYYELNSSINAFRYTGNITDLTITSGDIPEDYYEYFDDNLNLENLTILSEVTSIGNRAFNGCRNLKNITILSGVTSIRNNSFSGCSSLTEVTIPDSVTSIGDYAFHSCTSLESITIPDSVTSIGDSAFYACKLKNIILPNYITSISDGMFQSCSRLISITIPNNVTSIGVKAFYDSALSNITMPNTIKSIGDYAFYDCVNLTSITIPDSVTSIGDSAFLYCTSLTKVSISTNTNIFKNTKGTYTSFNVSNNNITDLIITSGTISNSYYRKISTTSNLKNVTLLDGVIIGKEAFVTCPIINITIPDSVTSIGDYAFAECTNLANIYYAGTEEQWNAITKGTKWNQSMGSNVTGGTVIHYNYTSE